jgi:uncharacterized membrane protein
MDFVSLLKFIHISAAVLWVGGGIAMLLGGLLLARTRPADDQMAHIRTVALLGPRLFMPASLLTLLSGLSLQVAAGWGWQPFTVLGLIGVAFTAAFGAMVLGPSCERAAKMAQSWGAVSALPMLRRIYRLAAFDYAVQIGIVFLMVVKPGWQDLAILGGLGAIITLAALAAFRPLPRLTT